MPRKNTAPLKVQTIVRRAEVMRLRMAGLTYEEIGQRIGISNVAAYWHVKRALEQARTKLAEATDNVRDQELRRLDRALVIVMAAMTPNPKKKPGASELAAVDRLLKIMERRAKYLGLDAPEKYEHAGAGGKSLLSPVIMLPPEDEDDEGANGHPPGSNGVNGANVTNGHGGS